MVRLLKWPLVVAVIVIVGRVLSEQAGVPDSVNNLLSAVALHAVVGPIYFAIRIAKSDVARPYRTLLKTTALFTALARSMVIPFYWLAYMYQWTQPRFSVAEGGNVGQGVSPFMGYVGIPFGAAILWILVSLVAGGGLGSILIAVKRKSAKKLSDTVAAR